MDKEGLVRRIVEKQSFLCVGLDPDPDKMPPSFNGDVLAFNRSVIDATRDYCVAYKPNTAFYEALGIDGMLILQETIAYIGKDHFVIADAKRGDIGNTSRYYARFAFDTLGADAITVAPYMGADSVGPFLDYPGKWAIVLALTSNSGSADFQHTVQEGDNVPLYAKVMRRVAEWGDPDRLMFVCGATQAEKFAELRDLCPDHFFLVPGIGVQGGDLAAVCRYGMNPSCGLLVNSSRGILYAEDPGAAARGLQRQMQEAMKKFCPELSR
ncbi:orotidine-5'-phosphate decarboxylase [Neolewinella xylanilytica]|uniref:Orotidine-5'-phosphate decarboxylase n=1 Tax=Neolewinella xylanilytica TaxID=1514080 RepID=A0A2S6I5K3_9BACT|nr:orotidine-5'-phosphate decarboxylase [Neolewinella xylanilytica]PPK86456.1 orotidine-5'-phosphate decarboxylase [Neolewinella xylanilytica]